MATETLAVVEQRIQLSHISWHYEQLLAELSDRRLRLTYYCDNLDIVALLPQHKF